MSDRFPHSRHLFRMACLFAGGGLLFVVARAAFVPKGFGELGHFRKGAIAENQARQPSFAGRDTCKGCHPAVLEAMEKAKSRHAGVGCEACHGPLAKHAENPVSKPARPDARRLCLTCHEANVAKPLGFKQIVAKEHNEGLTCTDCHNQHTPGMEEAK